MASEPLATDPSTELSMRRTGMSFQRTRLSAERTLMSVIRTSLSLISFGFTIFQVFQKLATKTCLSGSARRAISASRWSCSASRCWSSASSYHVQFMLGLRAERKAMTEAGLIHGESALPAVDDARHGGRCCC